MVRTKQTARKGGWVPGRKGDKLHKKAQQVTAARRRASTSRLKCTYLYKAPETQNQRKVGKLSLKEICYYQKSDKCLIPLLAFGRLFHEIVQDIQATAVAALQLGAEAYIMGLLEDANLCTIHTKHVTITPKDMWLAKCLRHDKVIDQNVESSAQLHDARRRK